jgi:hypothetical protein
MRAHAESADAEASLAVDPVPTSENGDISGEPLFRRVVQRVLVRRLSCSIVQELTDIQGAASLPSKSTSSTATTKQPPVTLPSVINSVPTHDVVTAPVEREAQSRPQDLDGMWHGASGHATMLQNPTPGLWSDIAGQDLDPLFGLFNDGDFDLEAFQATLIT